jgi:hypothetical protein
MVRHFSPSSIVFGAPPAKMKTPKEVVDFGNPP